MENLDEVLSREQMASFVDLNHDQVRLFWSAAYNEMSVTNHPDFSPWIWLASHLPNDGILPQQERADALGLLCLLIADFDFDVIITNHQNAPRLNLLKKVLSPNEMVCVDQSLLQAQTKGAGVSQPPRKI